MSLKHVKVVSRSRGLQRLLVSALALALVTTALLGAGSRLGFATPATAATPDCTPGSTWGTLRPDFAAEVLRLTNQHRATLGLVPLKISPTLTDSAVWKSRHMAQYRYMAHDDPAPPIARTFGQRVRACGYTIGGAGENIAMWYGSPAAVMQGWLGSPGHRANIENPNYRVIGVAAAASTTDGRLWWTQEFGTFDDSAAATPTPTTTPTATATPSATATPIATATPTVSPTATVTAPVTVAPVSIGIWSGTVASGGPPQLASKDGSFFVINSANATTSWYGRILSVPNTLKTLKVTFAAGQSAACTQAVWIWNWTTGAWLKLDSRAGTTAVQDVIATPTGTLADFVSGTTGSGEVAVAATCSAAAGSSFSTSADAMQVTYTP